MNAIFPILDILHLHPGIHYKEDGAGLKMAEQLGKYSQAEVE